MTPAQKIRAMRKLDVEAARDEFRAVARQKGFILPGRNNAGEEVTEDETILCALHKARLAPLHARLFNKAEKALSRRWLIEHCYRVPGGDA